MYCNDLGYEVEGGDECQGYANGICIDNSNQSIYGITNNQKIVNKIKNKDIFICIINLSYYNFKICILLYK